MPYVPPHLRSKSYYEDAAAIPKIATTPAEAQAMSKAVMQSAPKSALAEMLSAPAPKLAGKVTPRKAVHKKGTHVVRVIPAAQPLANLQAAKVAPAPAAQPVAANSFAGLIPVQKPVATKPKVTGNTKALLNPSVVKASKMVTPKVDPAYEAAQDNILRTLFEESIVKVTRIASANANDFTKRANGSYKNERMESRFKGFKMQILETNVGDARLRFQESIRHERRIASAHPLDFATRSNGSYVNERLESRFQGYLMALQNDFGQQVLKKLVENRVAALKTLR